ncbi:MgtC/SapB family protein [Thiobacter aerophilum]|uniref:DUF4010 domain-containing protein n=1 Tax=Thiobacter aerophilum TaxID=3121275 RepID=A0ABV0ECB7_9BURK
MDSFFAPDSPFHAIFPFLVSLGLGLLIGLERERNPRAKAGLRTFALTSLLGTLCAMLSQQIGSPWLLVVGFAAVAATIVTAYLGETPPETEPGTTTEAALLVSYVLGALVWQGERELSIMLAIVTTVLLYLKPEMQGIARRLTRRDLVSILQFAVLSFVILPVLPDRDFGPYHAFNPHQTWLMVVLISGISLAGYVALRVLGQRYGTLLLGFLGGLVSSTATTLVYARHGRAHIEMVPIAATVIALANLVVLVRLALLAAAVACAALPALLPVLGGGFTLGLLITALQWQRSAPAANLPLPETANPTELRTALAFGVLYALILFVASLVAARGNLAGLYGVAAVAGITDVDAITLSSLRLFNLGSLEAAEVARVILVGFLANLLVKLGLAFAVGGRALGLRCLAPLLATGFGSLAGLIVA